jgi:hypothetical protein
MPTTAVMPHYEANLRALLKALQTVAPTGRAGRWRGQILDVISRLVVQLEERGETIVENGKPPQQSIKSRSEGIDLQIVPRQCGSSSTTCTPRYSGNAQTSSMYVLKYLCRTAADPSERFEPYT